MKTLFSANGQFNWLRLLRFALGIFMGIQAFHGQDVLAGILSAILLWQAYTNAGCAWGACSVPVNSSNGNTEIEAEEVTAKK
ncbi:MAG: hypothetical protein MUC87_12700 [Bacteroidia bacterium]|jgi:hypothetical protein|nr:hypothetical protein [Bacteroidia bacterium]